MHKLFFDVRVFDPLAMRYENTRIPKTCETNETNEKEKKRQYNKPILNIEYGSFCPLLFTAMGGVGRECNLFHKRLSFFSRL